MSKDAERGAENTGRSAGKGGAARTRLSWKVLLAVGVSLLLVAVAVTWGRSASDGAADQSRAAEPDASSAPVESTAEESDEAATGTEAPMARRQPEDPTALGDVDAPVVMVAYSDYHCPYCGRWVAQTQPELMHYVESGDLRIEWRDFPIITDTSEAIAHASRAAAAQGAFWEFHEAYYAATEQPGERDPEETLAGIVDDLGLDADRFDEDRHGEAVASLVSRDFAEGMRIGVTSTPSFLINGQPVMGAQPLEVFEEVIDDSLEAATGNTGGEDR